MENSQIEIQLLDNSLQDNHYWKELISMFVMVGLKFEIHCWNEETEEIKAALRFGKKNQLIGSLEQSLKELSMKNSLK